MTKITAEQIEAFKKQQREKCKAELEKILAKYNCTLVGTPMIVKGAIVAGVDIVSVND